MSVFEIIFVALGGQALFLLALAWLSKTLASQLFAKDLERFKGELAIASSAATEKLKHELQIAAMERNVKFAKLHERRAEVIAEIYSLLVQAHVASESFVSIAEWNGEPSKQEKYRSAMMKMTDFFRFYDRNRIYLPAEVCAELEKFSIEMRTQVMSFGVYIDMNEQLIPDTVIRAKIDAWEKASEFFDKEMPEARRLLEKTLRKMLGSAE